MEECSFYHDDRYPMNRTACSTHGDRHPIGCAEEWAKEARRLQLQIEDLKKTSCSLRHADDLAEERDAALRLIEVVRKNDRLEYLCDCTAKDLGGPHLNGCIVKCILGTSEKRNRDVKVPEDLRPGCICASAFPNLETPCPVHKGAGSGPHVEGSPRREVEKPTQPHVDSNSSRVGRCPGCHSTAHPGECETR